MSTPRALIFSLAQSGGQCASSIVVHGNRSLLPGAGGPPVAHIHSVRFDSLRPVRTVCGVGCYAERAQTVPRPPAIRAGS